MNFLKHITLIPMLINVLVEIKEAAKDGKITVREVWA